MFISGVQVFLGIQNPEYLGIGQPAVVFYVQQELPRRPDTPGKREATQDKVKFKKTSIIVREKGRNILREHVFRAKL